MSRLNDIQRARLLELAVERATGGLSHDELRELEILAGPDAQRLDDSFERAAAAIHLASLPPVEPLPRALAARVADDADQLFAPQRQATVIAEGRPRTPAALPPWFAWGGWIAAAASVAAVVLLLGLQKASYRAVPDAVIADVSAADDSGASAVPRERFNDDAEPGRGAAATAGNNRQLLEQPVQSSAESESEGRVALLEGQRFVLRRGWAAAGDSTGIGVQGDVVWDARTQSGYMRFTGLRRNDPSQEQYQLWIFDGQRDQRYPVDGGVFDADGAGELVVPIRARLEIRTPLAFAVTIERPGGVVVSDRRRVVVIARVT